MLSVIVSSSSSEEASSSTSMRGSSTELRRSTCSPAAFGVPIPSVAVGAELLVGSPFNVCTSQPTPSSSRHWILFVYERPRQRCFKAHRLPYRRSKFADRQCSQRVLRAPASMISYSEIVSINVKQEYNMIRRVDTRQRGIIELAVALLYPKEMITAERTKRWHQQAPLYCLSLAQSPSHAWKATKCKDTNSAAVPESYPSYFTSRMNLPCAWVTPPVPS